MQTLSSRCCLLRKYPSISHRFALFGILSADIVLSVAHFRSVLVFSLTPDVDLTMWVIHTSKVTLGVQPMVFFALVQSPWRYSWRRRERKKKKWSVMSDLMCRAHIKTSWTRRLNVQTWLLQQDARDGEWWFYTHTRTHARTHARTHTHTISPLGEKGRSQSLAGNQSALSAPHHRSVQTAPVGARGW